MEKGSRGKNIEKGKTALHSKRDEKGLRMSSESRMKSAAINQIVTNLRQRQKRDKSEGTMGGYEVGDEG